MPPAAYSKQDGERFAKSCSRYHLIIKEDTDGSFKYMENKILEDGIKRIPEYQYRIRVSDDGNDRNSG